MGINISIGNYIGKSKSVAHSFHHSLVDYWNFASKSNQDEDRNTIKGTKGEILTAYNFDWNLGSGYGLFKEDYRTYKTIFPTGNYFFVIRSFIPSNTFVVYKYDTDPIKATKVRITGLTAPDQLTYEYSPSDGGSRVIFPIPEDGEYDLPESIQKSSGDPGYNVGFAVRGALTKNVTIKQIPEYKGAIVTDGIDDYLKLDKVGYKIGTVIIKYKAIPWNNQDRWGYIFDIEKERMYAGYQSKEAINNNVVSSNFLINELVGDYRFLRQSVIKTAETPLCLSTKSINLNETLSMALYDIAIYQDILTDDEVLKEIEKMNKV